MSSKYPILDNKPIDQWKVTALKDELKRRKLAIKGLKDDLIKRLDEALRIERENNGLDAMTGIDLVDNEPEDGTENSDAVVVVTEAAKINVNVAAKIENVGDVNVKVDINDTASEVIGQESSEGVYVEGTNSSRVEGEIDMPAANVETGPAASENVASEVTVAGQDAQITETQEVNGDSKLQVNNESSKPELDNEDSKSQLDSADPKPQLENEGLRSLHEDVTLDSSAPNNQVSEVSPNLGFQVKSDSISTDSVSINEKIEIKDNIITDNVKLELDVIKPQMVEPSTNNVVPVIGESCPLEVEEPKEKKMASVEEKDDSNATNADMSKKNDIVDVGYSEKLNLDRSSGDDSMEEDFVDSKQIDSKYNSDDVGDKIEKSEMHVVKEENLFDVSGNLSTGEKEMLVEDKPRPVVPAEKRKFNDQNAVGSTEPLKRQRRWNSESVKVPEPQSSNLAPTTTPKDAFQPALSRRSFSRSESIVSNEDTLKERVVPPSQKPTTNSLRIDRFLRPFTLKAVQELLGKTGSVTTFWMDHIKTHCYVSYSSVEEAIETRNAVYNLQWPPNGGRLLVAEFVDPQEVKSKLEAPQSPAAPVTPGAPTVPPLQPQPSPRQQVSRQQLPPPPSLPPPPPLANPPPAKERLAHLPPPPLPEKHDPPIVTLDDLFRKTRATPRIYYLPLSEEQVAAKIAERGKNAK